MRRVSNFILIFFLLLQGIQNSSFAEVLKSQEPRFAEAVLAYNAHRYDDSIKILNQLLTESPNLIEFLELKALALKTSKNDAESISTYRALIKTKTEANAPEAEIAPYHFELGMILFRSNSLTEAKPYFEFSLANHFNQPTSHFFLGMIAFQQRDPVSAVAQLEMASQTVSPELKGSALYYLAQSYLQMNDSSQALSMFSEAKTASEAQNDELNKTILKSCNQVLSPLDHSRKFASMALSLAFDSNVQALPNSLDGTLAFNKSSVKSLLQAGLGYMSSATEEFQWVPNYRLLYNYNSNRETREGEFLTQYFSLYLNHKPLERNAFGFKLDTSFTFQNQFDLGSNTEATYRIFSLTGALGAYYRAEIEKHWTMNLEGALGPQRYFGDQNVNPNDWRTGSLISLRMGTTRSSLGKFLNPGFYIGYLENGANGNEFYSKGASFTLSNGFLFTDQTRASVSFVYAPTFYQQRYPSKRVDRNYSLNSEFSHQLNPKWSLISDFSISYNESNLRDLYEYHRWTVSAGVSYSFY